MRNDTFVRFGFPAVERKKITAAIDGGSLTSDGRVMLPAAERRLDLAERLAGLIADPRNPLLVTHSLADILRGADAADRLWLRRWRRS
jgi:hypothetical protein